MPQITIGELLRRHRSEAELTQQELEKLIPFSYSTISRIERDERKATEDYIDQFIQALHLPEIAQEEIWAIYRGDEALSVVQSPCREDWGEAPDVSIFYGRYTDLGTLTQWVVTDRCRLVALLGMGGIGKTALATKLATQVSDQFETIIWRSLRNAPPLDEILAECVQFLSDQQEVNLPSDSEKRITRLLHYLEAQRCLLIFDNAESIMEVGRVGCYRDDYEDYGRLFQRIGEGIHQSSVLVTSREKPREIGPLEGVNTPVRSFSLTGLETPDGQQILMNKGLIGSDAAKNTLIKYYSGNPLALTIVADLIREVYDQDIEDFLTDEEIIFDEITNVLDEQFARLSGLEQSLMYWLAVEREPVSRDALLNNLIEPSSNRELVVALRSLRRRSLIEGIEADFTLQNVVMEYVTERLIEHTCEEVSNSRVNLFQSQALIKATSKTYVRESQERLILRPISDRLNALLNQQQLKAQLKGLLDTERTEALNKESYFAGNIINLIRYLGLKLSDFEFCHLAVRQAYLSGVNLQDVNFTCADLAKTVFTIPFGNISSVTFNSDGNVLAVGTSQGQIFQWQISDSQQLLNSKGHNDLIRSVAFSPDSRILASGSDDHTIKLWDLHNGQCLNTLQGHANGVCSVVFGTDSSILVSGSYDHTIKLWDIRSGQCLNTLQGHTSGIRSVAFSPDRNTLASGSDDHTIKLWDIRSGQCLNTLQGHTSGVRSVVFSPDRYTLASGSDDYTIKLWDIRSGQCLNTLQGHANWVCSVSFSPDGNILASGSYDQMVKLWDIRSGRCINNLHHTNRVRSVSFNPNGNILASGSYDQTVKLWDIRSGQCLNILQGHANWIRSVAFSPDGHILASSSYGHMIKLWDIHSGQCLNTLQGHTNWESSVTFSPNGHILASGSYDQTVKLWDIRSGQCLSTLQGHTNGIRSVSFSPDGHTLASGGYDQTIKLWDIHNGQCVSTLQGHANGICSVAFSPDGCTLASGSYDQTIKLWDIHNGQHLRSLQGHTDGIRSIVFSPNGRILASSSHDQTVKLWRVLTGAFLRTLRADRPYERMKITGVTGLTDAQRASLKSLGAIDENDPVVIDG